MTVIVEGPQGFHLGSAAFILEEDRELAWAERYIQRNPAFKWILGRYVEADNANENGHIFPLQDLKAAVASIQHSPLNMLHRPHYIVGAYVASEMIFPTTTGLDDAENCPTCKGTGKVDGDQCDDCMGTGKMTHPVDTKPGSTTAAAEPYAGNKPYVESLANFWRYYFPEQYLAVEEAHKTGQLYYSMEAVPEHVQCPTCDGSYEYAGRQSETYCDHLQAPGSHKRLLGPHFTGGALIIPPVKPGWKRADITELAGLIETNIDAAHLAYTEISHEFPHLDAKEWEAMMAYVLANAHA